MVSYTSMPTPSLLAAKTESFAHSMHYAAGKRPRSFIVYIVG